MSLKQNDQFDETLLNHNEDCQDHNRETYPDEGVFECVCELMERIRENEEKGEMQFETERGN